MVVFLASMGGVEFYQLTKYGPPGEESMSVWEGGREGGRKEGRERGRGGRGGREGKEGGREVQKSVQLL